MKAYSIRENCKVNTNKDEDTFVGINCDSDGISIHFPLGYRISDDEKELRKDILLMINSISITTAKKDSELFEDLKEYNQTAFPFHAYISVIYDFLSRGYYKERETIYSTAKKGKINWSKTIKNQKAFVQDGEVFYLDFVTRKSSLKENELITLIHEYCVYESFIKIGWLFTNTIPSKPRLKYNEKLFKSVLIKKMSHTFNDKNKSLFRNMLAIIDYQGNFDSNPYYRYGTYRFEYVWEALIDKAFGIRDKEKYFPKTIWTINGRRHDNACLEPDTIMIWNNDVYVLDAKYYKYGYTHYVGDLPESSSINKQITYGEYIAENEKFKKLHGDNMTVFNAFLMPVDSKAFAGHNEFLLYAGEANSNWKDNLKLYHRIQGIMIDTKFLMSIATFQDAGEIMKLADFIQECVGK